MRPIAFKWTPKRNPRLGVFLSLAISLSLITPLAPAALGAGRSAAAAPARTAAANPATPAPAVAPIITATKSDAFPDPDNDGKAVPGDTITYTVQITNSGSDATGVNFSDTLDNNTTFVPGSIMTTPVAVNDSYTAVGNVQISVPAAQGLTSNDSDPDGNALTASGPSTSAQNGNVSVSADGSFTYNPPPGFEGTDTFTYTINDGTSTDTATVTVNVSGMIWFIDASAAGGDGRLTSPYNSVSAFNAFAADQQGDNIFLYSGPYTGGLALQSFQSLIGQGATASLASITGLTPPSYSTPFPSTGGSNPIIGGAGGISIATDNLIRGVTIQNTAGTGISGSAYGTLTVADTAVNSTGPALVLDNGKLQAAFQGVSSTGSATNGVSLTNVAANSAFSAGTTTVTGAAGIGIRLNNIGMGSVVSFAAAGVFTRAATGIDIDAADGSVSFGATTIPNPAASGGYGIRVANSAAAVSFASATISDSKVTVAQADTNADGVPDTDGDGDAIFLSNNTGSFAVNGGALSNCGNDCVDARASSNVTVSGVAISGPGAQANPLQGQGFGGHGISALNLSGANGVAGSTISGFNVAGRDGLLVLNNAGSTTFSVAGSTFQNATGNAGILANARNTGGITLTVGGASASPSTDCTFTNLSGSAVLANADNTATLNATVQHSTFQTAPVNGKTNVTGATAAGATGSFSVLNNTFANVMRTASTGEGVISLGGGGTAAGNSFGVIVSGNMLTGVGNAVSNCGGGATPCLGSLNAISINVANATSVPNTIVVDGNTLNDAQQGGVALTLSNAGAGSSAVNAKIINNVMGTTTPIGNGAAATIRSGIRVDRTTNGGPSGNNVLVSGNTIRNGNGAAGSALNAPGIFLRAQNTNTLDATVTGNDVDTSSTGVSEMRVDTSSAGSTLCLDANTNVFASGAGVITLNETNGALNVEQASASALATANGIPAANVTVTGSPQFGVTCAAPVAQFFNAKSNRSLLASAAPRSGGAYAPLSGMVSMLPRTFGMFDLTTGDSLGRVSRPGALSLRYAAGGVALVNALKDTAVRPAREAAAEETNEFARAASPLAFSGETISLNVGTLPAGKSITIKFQATINNSINAAFVSNQGTVTGAGFAPVVTDDPATGAPGDPTVTQVGSPATISCPADISVGTDPGQFSASVAFTVGSTGTPAPTVDCKIGATSITSPHTFPVGTTAVQCTATNGVGSPATCGFNVTVADTQTPLISCPADINANAAANACDANVSVGTPTVSDNDPAVATNGVRSDAQALNAPYPLGTTTITWTATDSANNSASCQQTITVVDATAPVITLNGSASMTVECHTPFADPGATATDNCGGSVPVNTAGSVNSNAPGVYTLTYTASDASGNAATPKTRTVTVVDTTNPTVTLNGPASVTVECHTSFSDPGASASDSCAGPLPVSVSGSVNANAVGNYTLTYSATDPSGNTASATRTVHVVDTTAPTVTLNGANPMTVTVGSAFVDPGATASDSCQGPLPVSVSGSVNTAVIGTYTLTYTATDASGNTGTATRTVFVVYNFTGFFSPVSNPPVVNEVKAGQGVPVKFSLGGNQGLNILFAGYPASQQVGCANNVPINVLEETDTAGNSTLSYSGGTYTYNWKTEKSWAGTCRVLVVKLADGSEHIAYFKFK